MRRKGESRMTFAANMALVLLALIIGLAVKSKSPEISTLISVALCLYIISISVSRLRVISQMIARISEYMNVEQSYIAVLLKMVGISYICEFASGISKDAGYTAAASQIELAGKLTMLAVGLPVVLNVIDKIVRLLA